MSTAFDIELWGTEPAPQGSKTKWGTEANPRTAPWRAAVAAKASEVMIERGHAPLDGPVKAEIHFYFPRPKAHFGTGRNAGVLKESAPKVKDSMPDLDKLIRAIGDALTDVVITDDAKIAQVEATKHYTDAKWAPHPGVRIVITTL